MSRETRRPRWITATRPGTCARCSSQIKPDTRAFWDAPARRLYCTREECGPAVARERKDGKP